jgi:alpha-amylase
MKKSLNLIFHVHQPYSLRRYRFFDISNDHYYYDDYANESNTQQQARSCYLPACLLLLRKIIQYKGGLKVSFSISGMALDLFQKYAPEVILAFRKLADTGHVEFLGTTWSNSLAALKNKMAFQDQVARHRTVIKDLFNQSPSTFCNAELLYSDDIGALLYKMGFKSAVVEGGKPVLGWRSPDMLYSNAVYPEFKLLMRNQSCSDDLMFRFAEPAWEKYKSDPSGYVGLLEKSEPGEQVVNLCLDLGIMGAHYAPETGIFTFMESLLSGIVQTGQLNLSTPSETAATYPPASLVSVPHFVSWAADERNIAAFTGNELQQEALGKLFGLTDRILACDSLELQGDWNNLQASDYSYCMSSRFYAHDLPHRPNPFHTPHEAFVNYMNILSDIGLRLDNLCPSGDPAVELLRLNQVVETQETEIARYKKELMRLRKQKNVDPGNSTSPGD